MMSSAAQDHDVSRGRSQKQHKLHNGDLFTPSSTLFAKEIKLRRKRQGLPVYDGGKHILSLLFASTIQLALQ
jgi:hypothetical protein